LPLRVYSRFSCHHLCLWLITPAVGTLLTSVVAAHRKLAALPTRLPATTRRIAREARTKASAQEASKTVAAWSFSRKLLPNSAVDPAVGRARKRQSFGWCCSTVRIFPSWLLIGVHERSILLQRRDWLHPPTALAWIGSGGLVIFCCASYSSLTIAHHGASRAPPQERQQQQRQ